MERSEPSKQIPKPLCHAHGVMSGVVRHASRRGIEISKTSRTTWEPAPFSSRQEKLKERREGRPFPADWLFRCGNSNSNLDDMVTQRFVKISFLFLPGISHQHTTFYHHVQQAQESDHAFHGRPYSSQRALCSCEANVCSRGDRQQD